jgi:hypothetical protein
MIKPNPLIFTTLLSIFTLNLIAKIATAEVSQTYDEFSGQTTISVAPNLKNWKQGGFKKGKQRSRQLD